VFFTSSFFYRKKKPPRLGQGKAPHKVEPRRPATRSSVFFLTDFKKTHL
jgi:hypothetical protein